MGPTNEEIPRQWIRKTATDNFRKWLQAPEGAAPFEFSKILKSLGYSIDVTQRNLPPAVPCMLISLILAEAQNVEKITRAARWFFEVSKEGYRYQHAHQFLELLRRAMELRKSASSSWSGTDIWRAREDHSLVAVNSKVKLEERALQSYDIRREEKPKPANC